MSRPWKVAETGSSRHRDCRDLDSLLDSAAGHSRGPQQAVVGTDEEASVGKAQRDRAAVTADGRVDTATCTPTGM